MGSDIHIHIEIKIAGQWEHYGAPSVDRHYSAFSKMAGVRGSEDDAIALPKGMPDNPTLITEMAFKSLGGDGHSHSWLNSDEIEELNNWFDRVQIRYHSMESWLCTYLNSNGFTHTPEWVEDVRFVFWFNN